MFSMRIRHPELWRTKFSFMLFLLSPSVTNETFQSSSSNKEKKKKEPSPFQFFCRLHRFICDTFSCKSASYSCYPLSLLNRRFTEKIVWHPFHTTSFHFTSFRVCPLARQLLCNALTPLWLLLQLLQTVSLICSKLRLIHSPLFWIHASELISFENDIVRMLPLRVCIKQMMKLTKK